MTPRHSAWFLAGALILTTGMWYYIFLIWAPRGQHLSDLYASWYATRELFLHGRDPYSPAVTHEIQEWVYSGFEKNIPPGVADHDHQLVYPPYVCLLLSPGIAFDYDEVQWLTLLVLAVGTALSARWWTAALQWRPPVIWLATIVILVLGQCGIVQGLWYRQLAVLAATFLAAATANVVAGRLTLAGVLLAMSTVKPHLTSFATAWFLGWALANWRLRGRLLLGFSGTMIVLIVISSFLIPHWPAEFVSAVRAYPQYNPHKSILDIFFGLTLGRSLAIAVIGGIASVCYRMRHVSENSPAFILTLSLVLSGTVVVLPTIAPHSDVLLVLPALILVSPQLKFCRSCESYRLAAFSAWAMVSFQSLSAFLLTIAALLSSPDVVRKFWIFPFAVSPLLPIGFSIAVAFAIARTMHADSGSRSLVVLQQTAR